MYANRIRARPCVSDDSIMRDATTETRDLHVSILHVGASQMRLSRLSILVGAILYLLFKYFVIMYSPLMYLWQVGPPPMSGLHMFVIMTSSIAI
jgi:hypothetical protein